ncbi:MAG: ABC-F family ATP-binding cassette domain-containing protein [Rhodospirillales bacterium]|jgi:ATP-binding cassette subfamily F protein 3|nr:ABC-F family ATP-binding cassette domain-containing protein [Rhodospirillales bacterium]
MLRLDQITYRIGPRTMFDGASAAVDPGHRVGFVGRNGTGKTTLLGMLNGDTESDSGTISVPSRWRIGITNQEAPDGPENLIEIVLAADEELARLNREAENATDPHRIAEIHVRLHDKGASRASARAARLLAGLGFDEAAQQRPCHSFSGGWRMRVALAALLFTEPDLLLLDEPTNHLDLEATLWLENHLRHYRGTVLLVSHDRDLLNRVAEEILHLEGGKLTLYSGNYDRFEKTRRMRLAQNEKLRAKQDAQKQRIMKFVDRFRYKATKSKQAQSRLKMLERMEPIPEHRDQGTVAFTFPAPKPALASPLCSTDDVSVGYGGTAVIKNLSLRLDADDRIALIGANGNGKSTLMKLLAGRLAPMAGKIGKSGKLRVGYFAQHQADELDLAATPLIAMTRKRPRDTPTQVRAQLGRFGFGQEKAETKIGDLSGGEKACLLFALMSAEAPHILLLDEPVNHLDIDSRQSLVQAINAFEGAVVIVSHDPHLITLTADRFWLVTGGAVTPFEGDMDDYRAFLASSGGNGTRAATGVTGNERKERRREAGEQRKAVAHLKRELADAEAEVDKLETKREDLIRAIAHPTLYRDQGKSAQLIAQQRALGQVEKDLSAAEDRWAKAQEQWDAAHV